MEGPAYPARGTAWWLIAILFLASIFLVIDRGILAIVVDPVKADLALSDVQIGLLQGLAFGLFYATVGLPLGMACDRFSRRNIIIAGVGVWSLATVAAGLAHSFGALFAARLLVGLGEASLAPAAISLIADLFPPERRGRPTSLYLMGQSLAGGLAISVTSFIVAGAAAGRFAAISQLAGHAPWRVAFIVCGATGFVVVAALLTVREPARRGGPASTTGRGLRSSLATLFADRGTIVPLYLGFATCFTAVYGTGAWAPTMLMRTHHATAIEIGIWLGPLTMVAAILGPTLGGVIVDHRSRMPDGLGAFGVLLVAPLCLLPSALAAFAPGLLAATALVASSGAVVAVIGTAMFVTLQATVPPSSRGFAVAMTGLLNTILGAATGPLLVATLTEHVFHDPTKVGYSIAAVAAPSLLAGSALFGLAARNARRRAHAAK